MVARWLPIYAAAARIGCSLEQVQDLIEAKVLHAESIGGDHLSISAESVEALLPAPELATPSGDVLAAADDEDAMSAHLAAEQPAPSYRGGPRLDPQTEFEYEQERKK